jgi:hypothetical protein
LAGIVFGASSFAQELDGDAIVEMLRSDLKTTRIAAINATLKLSEAEGAKFWPIFREYDAELVKVGDQRVALIRDFVAAFATPNLNDQKARDLSRKWLQLQQARLDVWKKYHAKIETELSAERAAQFLQVEHQLSLLVDLKNSTELPLVKLGPAQP